MNETKDLGGALEIIGSDVRRVERYSDLGSGVWKEKRGKKGKIGILSHVSQSPESTEVSEKVVETLDDFKRFWKETFRPIEDQEFLPNRELVRVVFERARQLENDLNTLFVQVPEALKAWHPSDYLNKSDLQHKASETQVLGKDVADTVWQRALEQINGQRNRSEYNLGNSKEGGSWVLDALVRLDDIVSTERVTVSAYTTMAGQYRDNYQKFVDYVKSQEVNWTKVPVSTL